MHLLLAPLAAILLRANLPLSMATILLVNPLTPVPVFFGAYWVGAVLTGSNLESFDFALTWDWASENLVAIWKPFLLGLPGERNPGGAVRLFRGVGVVAPACACIVTSAAVARLRAQSGAIDQNPAL